MVTGGAEENTLFTVQRLDKNRYDIDLIVGENEIIVEVENVDDQNAIRKLTVIREKKEEPKEEKQESSKEDTNPIPVLPLIKEPVIQPLPPPEPQPNPIIFFPFSRTYCLLCF